MSTYFPYEWIVWVVGSGIDETPPLPPKKKNNLESVKKKMSLGKWDFD